jgi:hypothetical protein
MTLEPHQFGLVPLCSVELPWAGLPVYHPWLQINGTAYWRTEHYPEPYCDYTEPGPAYDLGTVRECVVGPWSTRVVVVFADGGTREYDADNLWVPENFPPTKKSMPTQSRTFLEEAKRIAWRRSAPVEVLLALIRKFKGKEAKVGPPVPDTEGAHE